MANPCRGRIPSRQAGCLLSTTCLMVLPVHLFFRMDWAARHYRSSSAGSASILLLVPCCSSGHRLLFAMRGNGRDNPSSSRAFRVRLGWRMSRPVRAPDFGTGTWGFVRASLRPRLWGPVRCLAALALRAACRLAVSAPLRLRTTDWGRWGPGGLWWSRTSQSIPKLKAQRLWRRSKNLRRCALPGFTQTILEMV